MLPDSVNLFHGEWASKYIFGVLKLRSFFCVMGWKKTTEISVRIAITR